MICALTVQVRRPDRDENKHNNQLSGDMWASQKENKTNMVPLIVEDVDHPGNILIEVKTLCKICRFLLSNYNELFL